MSQLRSIHRLSTNPSFSESGQTYTSWASYVESHMLLQLSECYDVTIGDVSRPDSTSAAYAGYMLKSKKAKAVLILVSEPDLHATISDAVDSREAWAALRIALRPNGLNSTIAEMRKLHTMTKEPDQPMREWVAAVRTQVRVLDDLGVKLRWDEVFVTLSQGLGERYDAVLTHLGTLSETERTYNIMIQALMDQETRVDSVASPSSSSVSALAAGRLRNNVICFTCQKPGHYSDKCPTKTASKPTDMGMILEKLNSLAKEVSELREQGATYAAEGGWDEGPRRV